MATFKQTGNIQRSAPTNLTQGTGVARGGAAFANFLSGMDKYGNQSTGFRKFAGSVVNTINPLTGATKRNVRNRYKGTQIGSKAVKQANKAQVESWKNKAEVALLLLTAGGSKAVSAGVKGAKAAAQGAKGFSKVGAAAKGFKSGKAAYKAGKIASASAKGATAASKTGNVLTQTVSGAGTPVGGINPNTSALANLNIGTGIKPISDPVGLKTFQTANQGLNSLQPAVRKVATNKPTVIGNIIRDNTLLNKDTSKLLGDLVDGYKMKGQDKSFGAFAKDFYKTNKVALDEAGIKNSRKALRAAYKSYQENNPDPTPSKTPVFKQEEKDSQVYDKFNFDDELEDQYGMYMKNGGLVTKYKKGGLLKGKSHEQGGEKATVGENNIELEGGERVFSVSDTNKMDSMAENQNYAALGKKYAQAKENHDKAEGATYGNNGLKVPPAKLDTNWAYKQAELAGAPYPQVTAAQWSLESSNGTSNVAKATNNYFGIKYDEGAAERLRAKGIKVKSSEEVNPDGYYDPMEKKSAHYMYFPNPADSFKAHQLFLETNPRYANALKANNAVEYAKGLKAAGYATDPNYASKLIGYFGTAKARQAQFGTAVAAEDLDKLATARTGEISVAEVTNEDVQEASLAYLKPSDRRKYEAYKKGQTYVDPNAQKLMEIQDMYFNPESEANKQWEENSGYGEISSNLDKLTTWKTEAEKAMKEWQDGRSWYESSDISNMPYDLIPDLYPELLGEVKDLRAGNSVGELAPDDFLAAIRKKIADTSLTKGELKKIRVKQGSTAGSKALEQLNQSIRESDEFKALSPEKQTEFLNNIDKQKKFYQTQLENAAYYDKTKIKAQLSRTTSEEIAAMSNDEFIQTFGGSFSGLDYSVSQGGKGWVARRGSQAKQSAAADMDNRKLGQGFIDFKPQDLNLPTALIISETEMQAFGVVDDLQRKALAEKNRLAAIEANIENERQRELAIDQANIQAALDAEAEEKDEDKIDVETENEISSLFSDEDIKAHLNMKNEQREQMGLGGIMKKMEGADTLLGMGGMYASYKSAIAPMPEQKKSAAWKDYMAVTKARAQQGIDPATSTLFQRQAERTYASDVANIGRMATSGQAALGALGQASRRKYAADMKMGAQDSALREQHFGEYAKAVGVDENLTQQMWERNVYDEASRKRDLQAGLIKKVTENVRDDMMYNKQYGDGSQYAQLMQETIKARQSADRSMLVSQIKTLEDAGVSAEDTKSALGIKSTQ